MEIIIPRYSESHSIIIGQQPRSKQITKR